MTDYGLDLALIGNGRTAALVEPGSRITWWCFPRFDSNPVFSRLLAGDEETATQLEVTAASVVPTADQIDNTYTDKQLTEEEEAQWNDLFLEVLGG